MKELLVFAWYLPLDKGYRVYVGLFWLKVKFQSPKLEESALPSYSGHPKSWVNRYCDQSNKSTK